MEDGNWVFGRYLVKSIAARSPPQPSAMLRISAIIFECGTAAAADMGTAQRTGGGHLPPAVRHGTRLEVSEDC